MRGVFNRVNPWPLHPRRGVSNKTTEVPLFHLYAHYHTNSNISVMRDKSGAEAAGAGGWPRASKPGDGIISPSSFHADRGIDVTGSQPSREPLSWLNPELREGDCTHIMVLWLHGQHRSELGCPHVWNQGPVCEMELSKGSSFMYDLLLHNPPSVKKNTQREANISQPGFLYCFCQIRTPLPFKKKQQNYQSESFTEGS